MQDTPAELLRTLLSVEPDDVRPTSSPVAYLAGVDTRQVLLKMPASGRPGSALAEAWAYGRASAHGVSTSAIRAVSDDPECFVADCLPGRSLWERGQSVTSDRVIWQQMGEDLRRLHEVKVPGFGPLVIREGVAQGAERTWSPFVDFTRSRGLEQLGEQGYLDAVTVGELERRYDDAGVALTMQGPGSLVHGDMEGGHVFAVDGHYVGVIDFGQAQIGDPRWDLARIALWDGPAATDAVIDGYGSDAIAEEDRQVVFPLYLLAFVVAFAARAHAEGRPAAVVEHLQIIGIDAAIPRRNS